MTSRILLLILAVFLIPVIPWLVLGWYFEPLAAGAFLPSESLMASPVLAALLGLCLLAADSFLPVPSTIVMSGIGYVLGVWWGGLLASLGVFLSGSVAYFVCRRFGSGLAVRLAGEKNLERMRATMDRYGTLVIAVTRSVPIIQEASACLAGLTGLPAGRVLAALAVGSLPTGFAYAFIGASVRQSSTAAAVLSMLVPALTWPLIAWLLKIRK